MIFTWSMRSDKIHRRYKTSAVLDANQNIIASQIDPGSRQFVWIKSITDVFVGIHYMNTTRGISL